MARTLLVTLGVTLALLQTSLLLADLPRLSHAENIDFFTFIRTAEAWRAGEPLYRPLFVIHISDQYQNYTAPVAPNLNHPVMALLFVPLTFVPHPVAYLLWTAFAAACWFLAVAVSLCPLALRRRDLAFALVLAAFPGFHEGIIWGQVSPPLALAVVVLARLVSQKRRLAAPALAGLLIALKPFLLPVGMIWLVRRDVRAVAAMAGGGAAISLAALPFVGWQAFADWAAALARVTWYNDPHNISVIGVVSRAVGQPATLLPPVVLLASLGFGWWLLQSPSRTAPRVERDLALLLPLSILGSPIGWLHYTPILLPTASRLARGWSALPAATRGLAAFAAALLWLPDMTRSLVDAFDVTRMLALSLLIAAVFIDRPLSRARETPQPGRNPI